MYSSSFQKEKETPSEIIREKEINQPKIATAWS